MLALKNIRVRSFDLDFLDVYWEVDGAGDPNNYEFSVLRGEAEFGPFVAQSAGFVDRYHFRDISAPQIHFTRKWYYKIKVTDRRDTAKVSEFPDHGGVSQSADLDLQGLEMARQERIRLEEFIGRVAWIFPARTFGQRCPCFDPVTKVKRRSNCITCYGTGFVGGYHTPIRVSINITDSQDATQSTDMATFQPAQGMGRLSNFPEVKYGDLVVEAENLRWCVDSPIMQKKKLRATYRQEFPLKRMPKDDVVFKLPIKIVEQKDFQASPERQFTLPRSPEGTGWESSGGSAYSQSGVVLIKPGTASGPGGGVTTVLVATHFNASPSVSIPEYSVVALVSISHSSANRDGLLQATAVASADDAGQNQLSDIYGIVQSNTGSGATTQIVRAGRTKIRKPSAQTWLAGEPIWLSDTLGTASNLQPTASPHWSRLLGYAAEGSTGNIGLLDIGLESKVYIG